jgi:Uma2 family endonuclease
MATRIQAPSLTVEEFTRQYGGKRYEYVDGRALPMGPEIVGEDGEVIVSPTKSGHGLLVDELAFRLNQTVRQHKLGRLFGAETGFIMQEDPREIRAADIAFYSRERLKAVRRDEWLPFPPDLAVEVLSEFERAVDLRRKIRGYLANGTRLLLIVYPTSREIEVHQPAALLQVLGLEHTLSGGEVLPGFSLPLKDLFAVLDELGEE